MFIFVYGGIGVVFLILGPFLIFGGLRTPEARMRLVYSGLGSIIVGLGNLLMAKAGALGIGLVILGMAVIFRAAKIRS